MIDHLLSVTVVLLAVSLGATLLLRQLRAPTLVGYILTGILLGPSALGVLRESEALDLLAEIGVVFLMFYVGLEFSLSVLLEARRAVFGAGGAQVAVTTGLGMAVAGLAGFDPLIALLLGGAVAMSSTAITVRQLSEQDEMATAHGRLSVGILLFQDLATLPFLVLVAALGAQQTAAAASGTVAFADLGLELARRLGAAGVAFALAVLLGRRLLERAVGYVARTGSRELFMLAVLLLVLGAALLAHQAGLSPPLGAFLAGMVLGETNLRREAEKDIRPFREVLIGLFFVTVGLQVQADVIFAEWRLVLMLLAALIGGKGAVIYLILTVLREPSLPARRAAITLAHGGEFGLLILSLALAQGVLAPGIGQPLLGAIALSMMAAPFLMKAGGGL